MVDIAHIAVIPLKALQIDKNTFCCSSEPLNVYFKRVASQDEKRDLSKCFVLIHQPTNSIIGYYTLSAKSIPISHVPQGVVKNGVYQEISAALIGRLAIDQRFAGQGYGKFLVIDAIFKIKDSPLGVTVLTVDAKDESAVKFYQNLGFIKFIDFDEENQKLFLPLKHFKQHFSDFK
ncbi:GNAT family N-acetyltransferase [Lonepinella sp. MS14437]|uniref:GNAT family N-acetyltransferase n=1 Tax=Lonepinella sp. MS14437 TaxID=3003620 RepID=UPI0036D7CB01